MLGWEEDIDYWNNENCPKDYLEDAFIRLADFVEGAKIDKEDARKMNREKLVEHIDFLEYVADK